MSQVRTLNSTNFEAEVILAAGPVLVDFYADWCGPCKVISPIVEDLANEYESKVRVVKVDVDASQQLAASYGIRSIPTLLVFKNGEIAETVVGAVSRSHLGELLDKHAV